MAYENPFHEILEQLSNDARWVLQWVHRAHGGSLNHLPSEVGRIQFLLLERYLEELEEFGLVIINPEGIWRATWVGVGVSNWCLQLNHSPGQTVCEPRFGENGDQLGPLCRDFRPLLFSPGLCWCCRPRRDHASEVVRSAIALLRTQTRSGLQRSPDEL